MSKKLVVNIISTLIVVAIVFILAEIMFSIAGLELFQAFRIIVYGALGRTRGWSESLVRAIPIILTSLTVCVAFKAGLWNVGAEGQFYAGAIGATFVALFISLPRIIHLPLVILAAFIAGALFALIAAVLRAYFNVNEILTTLMLNFVGLWFTQYLVRGPWESPDRIISATAFFPESAQLFRLTPTARVHQGIYISIISVVVIYLIMKYTAFGQKIKIMGTNLMAASYAKINIKKQILLIFILSGGLAGLAGAAEVTGLWKCLRNGSFPIEQGYGFIGLGAALMGNLHPIGAAVSSIFFGILLTGSSYLKSHVDLHAHTVNFVIGLLIIGMVSRHLFRDRIYKFIERLGF